MTTAEKAGASLSRVLGPCWHHQAAPVVLCTGEVVASVCEECLAQLPASWGCDECAYVEIRKMGQINSTRIMGQPCGAHRNSVSGCEA